MLEGDDDAVSLLQEKEIDNLAGKLLIHLFSINYKVINIYEVIEPSTSLWLTSMPMIVLIPYYMNVNKLLYLILVLKNGYNLFILKSGKYIVKYLF